nr:hypothetical protein CFP56_29942 [Quercus suber]
MVFVPGAWHSSNIYGTTMNELAALDFQTMAVELPSVGADPAHPSFEGDVYAVRTHLSSLIEDEGKEVILVSHSYSSMPALDACYGLARRDRLEQGLDGGVIRLVLIMAFAVPEGFQPTASGAQYPYWMRVDANKGVVNVLPEAAKAIFYNDVSEEEREKWAARLRPQSVGVYSSITIYTT